MLASNHLNAYNNRGLVKYKLGYINAAIEDYTKAIVLDPNDGIPYYNRGLCKEELQDFDGACLDVRKSQELGYEASELIDEFCN